jgi:pilus assembly protein CpaC
MMKTLQRTGFMIALGVLQSVWVGPALAQSQPGMTASTATRVTLNTGTSRVYDLPDEVRDIFVSDPAVAYATLRSDRKLVLTAKTAGQADVILQDGNGKPIGAYNIVVSRNANELREIIRAAAPDSKVVVTVVGKQVLLTGETTTIEQLQAIETIARNYMGENNRDLINQMAVRDSDQVMIKVTVAEVQKSLLKSLGIKTQGNWTLGNVKLTGALGSDLSSLSQRVTGVLPGNNGNIVSLAVLERTGALRTLAEPTLTALSGQTATFKAGGEVPVVTGVTCLVTGTSQTSNCTPSVTFKEVGVKLGFAPTVLGSGRIRLRVQTSIIEIDQTSFATILGTTTYGFRTRDIDTTVELPSGGSLMAAGLLQQQSSVQMEGAPGLSSLPVLGALFRSREYQRRETELLIVVVPFIAKESKPEGIPLPTDSFVLASDAQQVLLGQISKRNGTGEQTRPTGLAGFAAK